MAELQRNTLSGTAYTTAHDVETPLLALRIHHGDDDETALLARAREGDDQARAWLVERWSAPMYRFCRRMLHNDEDARDAAQDTLVKVLRSLEQYDPQRSFSTWAFGIARNTCIDEYRRRTRRAWEEPTEVVDTAPTPLARTAQNQEAEMLTAALDDLQPLYREVLVLYHFEHLKYGEIAEALEIPMGTVMNRIFRARQKLRAIYEQRGGAR